MAPGDSVVLLGAGAIGSFILAALAGHDGPVIAVDLDDRRLEVATLLGATEVLRIERNTTGQELLDLLPAGARAGADVVFETSGAPGAAQRACALAARGGTVMLVGLNPAPQPLSLADLVLREVSVRTTVAHVCGQDLPAALRLLGERPLSAAMIDRVVTLDDVVAGGLRPLADGEAMGKILVRPGNGAGSDAGTGAGSG